MQQAYIHNIQFFTTYIEDICALATYIHLLHNLMFLLFYELLSTLIGHQSCIR